jgi:outer membrane protein OmpA-like peptidoglycan-associated protein/flagellar hook assembly protein FlgD
VKHQLRPALVFIALIAALAACTTVGEIPVELDTLPTVYISPANQDGVQDAAVLPLSVVPLERTVITRATVTVTDAAGVRVYTSEQLSEDGGLVRRPEGIEPAEAIFWDGRDDAGEFVPDGAYTLIIEVEDSNGNTGTGPDQTIIVDNTPPFVEVSAPFLLFTPNGDDRLDLLAIYQRNSTDEDEWVGTMVHAEEGAARRFSWDGGARDFTWDGTTDAGTEAPEGEYTYTLSATDRAGNAGSFSVSGIELDRDPAPIALSFSRRTISPNGDGRAESATIYPTVLEPDDFESWRIEILSPLGDVTRSFEGTGLPGNIVFDGRDSDGATVTDGDYQVVFRAVYAGGREPVTTGPPLVVDTQPPRSTVRLSAGALSPDGDGVQDTVTIRQSSSNESTWTARFTSEAGTRVRTETWSGRVTDLEWDGTDDSGNPLPDGLYTYRLYTIDEGENEAVPGVVSIRLDTTPPDVSVESYPPRFSPDGDGVDDVLLLTITAEDAGRIGSWEATVLDPTGQPFREWSGTGAPVPLRWDGRSDEGEVVQSAELYNLEVAVTDAAGNRSDLRDEIRIGILIEREGERLRIRISSIYFVPYTSDYVNLEDPNQAARNLETLDGLATVLEEYPEYSIRIEGHAVSLLFEDPDRAQTEQTDVLVPLSLARANVIRDALIERGVDPARMSTAGYGGARPVVPHWDLENRWKNRRVEFVLERE